MLGRRSISVARKTTSGCRGWLEETLGQSGLDRPDGRPLYAYQVTRERYDVLVEELRRLSSSAILGLESQSVAGAFCIYVAEWWRREYAGGPWAWAGPVDNLGWDHLTYARLLRFTEQGLKYWQRELHQHDVQRAFLGTLASEGGLPVHLIREGAPLKRYIKLLMQDIDTFGSDKHELLLRFAAERGEGYLPRSFRYTSIYEVAAALARFAWEFGAGRQEASAEALQAELAASSSWRNKLPLSLEDEAAAELLSALLSVAAQLRAGADRAIRVRTCLHVGAGGDPRLVRQLVVPAGCGEATVVGLLGDGIAPPGRFDLFMADEEGTSRTLASFARFGDRYRVTTHGSAAVLNREGSAEAIDLWTVVGERVIGVSVTGSRALAPDLPWVFVPASKGGEGEGEWELAAQGSLRTAHARVLIAVDADFDVSVGEQGELRAQPGAVEDRNLQEASGHVVIEGPDGRYSVRTASKVEDDTSGQYMLFGSHWDVDPEVFTDMPTLRRVRADGTAVECNRHELSWRPLRARGAWRPYTQRARGAIRVRHCVESEVMAELRASVVPAEGRMRIRPEGAKRGKLVLAGFNGGTIGVEGPVPSEAEVKYSSAGSDSETELMFEARGEVPTGLELVVSWPNQEMLWFRAPFPAEGCRFISRRGTELPSGLSASASLSMNRMGGVIAEGRSHSAGAAFQIKAQLHTHEGPAEWGTFDRDLIVARDRVTHRLDLGAIRPVVYRLFSLTDDIGASVELRIDGGRGWSPRVWVRRFAGDVAHDPLLGTFFVSCDDGSDVFEADRMEAINLEDPSQRVTLVRDERAKAWRLPEALSPGCWLVFAFAGEWPGWRPKVQVIEGCEPPSDAMIEAIRTASPGVRREMFAEIVREMAEDPDDDGWRLFDTYVHQTADVPPVVFDLVRAVALDVRAVVMAVFRAPNAGIGRLWDMFEAMGVVWETVPAATWLAVARARYHQMARIAADLPPPVRELVMKDVLAVLESDALAPRQRLTTLVLISALADHCLRRRATPESSYLLGLFGDVMDRAPLALREEARLRLCRNLADAQWPTWGPFKEGVVGLRLPAAFNALLLEATHEHQELVLNAPVVAAIAAARGFPLDRAMRFQIQTIADAQPEWFGDAYHNTFTVALRIALSMPEGREMVTADDD